LIAYTWTTGFGSLRLALEWLNLTLAREATDIACDDGITVGRNPLTATPCKIRYAPAIFFPNLGLRGQFR
jgi:hypothetical protein